MSSFFKSSIYKHDRDGYIFYTKQTNKDLISSREKLSNCLQFLCLSLCFEHLLNCMDTHVEEKLLLDSEKTRNKAQKKPQSM